MLDVLSVREARDQYIQKYFERHGGTLAVVKANYPTGDKRNPYTSYVAFVFAALLERQGWKRIKTEFEGEGLVYYLVSEEDAALAKEYTVGLEEAHQLGRLADIDIYDSAGQKSRLVPRKCFLCEEEAFICVRTQRHSIHEVIDFFEKKVLEYIFALPRQRISEFAMIGELSRSVSFGTVNFLTRGSHDDMTEEDFYRSVAVLAPEFERLTEYPNHAEAKKLGIEMEKLMLEKVGVNTHQGLIFHLLILYTSEAAAGSAEEFRANIVAMGQSSMEEFRSGTAKYTKAYREYGLSGARGSAATGYGDVFTLMPHLDKLTVDEIFIHLARETGDTNILRRGGIAVLNEFKRLVAEIEDEETLRRAEEFAIKMNISAGGAADLVAVALACLLIYKKNGWEMGD